MNKKHPERCSCEEIIRLLKNGKVSIGVSFDIYDDLEAYFGEIPSIRVSDVGLDLLFLTLKCPDCKKRFRIQL